LERAERAAERVLDHLRIVESKDLRLLEEIAYERGAVVREKAMRGAEARLTLVGGRAVITLSDAISNPLRKRFSIAHELGHLEMHRLVSSFSLCSQGDIDEGVSDRVDSNREQEANAFAAALLMPRRIFKVVCQQGDPTLETIQELAHYFYTSLTATALRYTQFCEEATAIVFSQRGIVTWFRRSKEFEEMGAFVEVKSRLDADSLAYSIHRNGRSSGKQRRVPAASWLAPGNYRDDATIMEQSWPLAGYDSILTLLWIYDDISSEDYYWSTESS
jgi:Zn-dependent peptidase ImmA (M78 family)